MRQDLSDTTSSQGMILDDAFSQIRLMRTTFNLPEPRFGLSDIEKYPGASEIIAEFVRATIDKHGFNLYVRPGVLSFDNDPDVLEPDPVGEPHWPRYRLHPSAVERALREVLEEAFQTIGQLPSKFLDQVNPTRKIKSIMARLEKCAAEVEDLQVHWRYLDRRFSEGLGSIRLGELTVEVRRMAEILAQGLVNSARVEEFRINPVNPQVSLALFLADFFASGTDRKRYDLLDSLTAATFSLLGKPTPKWVGRLHVEMSRKRKLRRAWARRLTATS
jgi:hypothetical protein